MTLFPPAHFLLHFLVDVVHLLFLKFFDVAFILFVFIKFVRSSEVKLFILFLLCFFHFLLELNSLLDNGVPFMAVHFSKILIGVTINLIDRVFFDKLEFFFENIVELVKVRSDFFFIFKHHLNNLRQFLILSFVENVGRILLSRLKIPAVGYLSGDQLIKSQAKTVDIILERI
jgi:hypothetical protein